MMSNLYTILQLTPYSSADEIKQRMAKLYATGQLDTVHLEEAKKHLLNPDARAQYDTQLLGGIEIEAELEKKIISAAPAAKPVNAATQARRNNNATRNSKAVVAPASSNNKGYIVLFSLLALGGLAYLLVR